MAIESLHNLIILSWIMQNAQVPFSLASKIESKISLVLTSGSGKPIHLNLANARTLIYAYVIVAGNIFLNDPKNDAIERAREALLFLEMIPLEHRYIVDEGELKIVRSIAQQEMISKEGIINMILYQ